MTKCRVETAFEFNCTVSKSGRVYYRVNPAKPANENPDDVIDWPNPKK